MSASDNECLTESTAYDVFRSFSMAGIPVVLANSYDAGCDVHAIMLELLGPTLDDLCRLRPGGKLEDRMVLAVAIQMASFSSRSLYPENRCYCLCQLCSLIATRTFTPEE